MKKKFVNLNKSLLVGILVLVCFFGLTSRSLADPTITVTVTANPVQIVTPPGTSVITWAATNAVSCDTGGHGTATSGSFTTPSLSTTTSYTVKCTAQGASCKSYNGGSFNCPTILNEPDCTNKMGYLGNTNEYTQVCYWDARSSQSSVTVGVGGGFWQNNNNNNTGTGTSITNVLTGDATAITDTTAKLSGSLNPGGTDSAAYFRYSTIAPGSVSPIFCNDIYGSNMIGTNEVKTGAVDHDVIFTTSIGNLTPNTTYYYCAVGSNNAGIAYSKNTVKSFTTKLSSFSTISITTKPALVVDGTSAWLNGSYNVKVYTDTWFEYRKINTPKNNINSLTTNPISQLIEFIKLAFGANKAMAAANTNVVQSTLVGWSDKMDQENHGSGTTGDISYLLTGLSPSATYEFRAVIEASADSIPTYGDTLTFTTKAATTVDPGVVPGTGNTDPCAQSGAMSATATSIDVNCNGANGNLVGGGSTLPDLTASIASPDTALPGIPVTLSSTIKNQGKTSTLKSFYNFFQVSTVPRSDATPTPTPGVTPIINVPVLNTPAASFLENIFKTKEVYAAASTTNSTVDTTLINLPATLMSALGAGSSNPTMATYTFSNIGTYYIRACADKTGPVDVGLIKESYENNNCGPWRTIAVANATNNVPPPASSSTLTLGETATPPVDATVHYHEGIETVFQRQIVGNSTLAKAYGYQDGADIQTFAWNLADLLAKEFGYVSPSGKEIRVSLPDIAAYQLEYKNGVLTVYEYYNLKIVNIESTTTSLRNKYDYEYYFVKK